MAIIFNSVSLLIEQVTIVFLTGNKVLNIVLHISVYSSYVFYIGSWVCLLSIFYVIYGSLYHLRKRRFLKYTKLFSTIYEKFFHKQYYEMHYRTREKEKLSLFKSITINSLQKVWKGGCILVFYDDVYDPIVDIVDAVRNAVQNDETVDYVSTYRSPIVFCDAFQEHELANITKRLSIIDCFTPHYGFDDKVVKFKKREYIQKGFIFFDASSFANVHTAANNSWYRFRKMCKQQENEYRVPHRTIYDTLSSLIDFSSEEQYLVFLRHVIASERSYGMISIIFEPRTLPETIKGNLTRMADIVLEFTASEKKVIKQ